MTRRRPRKLVRGPAQALTIAVPLLVGWALRGGGSPPPAAPPVPPGIPPVAPPEPEPPPFSPYAPTPTGIPGPIPTYTPSWHDLWSSQYGRIGAWEGYYGWDGNPVCTRWYVVAEFYTTDVPAWVKAGVRVYADPYAGRGGDVP